VRLKSLQEVDLVHLVYQLVSLGSSVLPYSNETQVESLVQLSAHSCTLPPVVTPSSSRPEQPPVLK